MGEREWPMRWVSVTTVLLALAPRTVSAFSAQFQRHPVQSVPRGDRVVVDYAGLPVTVRLAHLGFAGSGQAMTEAQKRIRTLVTGKRVRVAYCPEAGLDADGFPQVYVFAGVLNVNEELVQKGLARYEPGKKPSRHYHQKMARADSIAREAGLGLWASGGPARKEGAPAAVAVASPAPGEAGPAGGCYSELNSSLYHTANCRWALRMSPQRRIRYRSFGAAERVGKKPCWICLGERANKKAFGHVKRTFRTVRGKGPLLGYRGRFHAPNCEEILDRANECAEFKTAGAPKAAGLAPCTLCLRLSGGEVPLPSPGECIGRAPPHRRPCRRAPSGESGLCLRCLGKGE